MRKTVKVLLTVALAVLMVCTLVACGDTDTQQTGNDVNYTISFETNGGSPVANLVVDGKSEITIPQTTKEGYFFAGWFVDNGTFNVRFNLAYITANSNKTSITVYAKWSVEEVVEQTYTVAFDSNGGSAVENIVIAAGNTIKLPTAPTKTGYSFVGWFVDNNTFQIPFDLDYIKANPTFTSITLYAKWKIDSYTVTFETSGGSTIASQKIDYNGFANKPTAPTKVCYSFDGWYKEASFVTGFNFATDKITANTKIYAKWKINSYTVTFETSGGSTIASQKIDYNGFANKPTAPTKVGYSFDGWCKDVGCITPFNFATEKITANTTIYAKWKIDSYTVTFETSGGSTIASQKIDYNGFATTPIAPTKANYSFDGWCKEVGCITAFDFTTEKITANTTIYAKWKIDSYTVTFETSGGSAIVNQTIDYNCFATAPTAPTKVGYSFDGWCKDESLITPFAFATEKITANTTIYAKWKIDSYTVTFETNGGSTIASQTIDYNSFATTPIAPTKVGFVFDGWCKEVGCITAFAFTTEKITANTTIYAKWVAVDDCLTFTFTDSSNSAYSVKQKYGATLPNSIDLPAEYNSKPVVAIGYRAFYLCSSLTSVTIPSSVTSIGESAFEHCSSLTSVIIPAGVTSIGERAFEYCSSLTSVTIPAGVTSIGKEAFRWCHSLTSVTIPSSVTSIGESAFLDCSSLTSITIPSSVASIGKWSFSGCRSLTSVTIPASVTSIGESAFSCCSSLTSITVESDNTEYKNIDGNLYSKDGSKLLQYAIGKTDTSFTIPEGVTSIGYYAFDGCHSLTSVTIPASVTSIGYYAFYGCRSLTSVTIPSSVTSIGNLAFDGCSNLTSVIIPAGVTSIGNYAFSGCSSLTSVTFEAGSKLSSIGYYAFSGCRSLTSVTIPLSVTSIGTWAFAGCRSLTSVTIPASVTSIGDLAFEDCSSLTGITVASDNTKYKSIDGNLYSKDGSTLLQYAIGKTDTSFTIPEGVTNIGYYAFSECSSLTSVTIPSSVTSIGGYVFSGCSSLTSVTIPSSVTSIGESAFYWCSNLTSVTIPSSVTSIGEGAFYWCSSLTSVIILEGVTSIGDHAFYDCSSLISVTIPSSVTSIGGYAFYCCSSLTSVTIPSSVTSIGYFAFDGCSSLTIYAQAASKQAGWNSNWNYSSCPVVWDSANNIIASDGNIYAVLEGIRYALKDGKATVVRQSRTITTANIPASVTFKNLTYNVTSIGDGAFYGCSSLTSVTIPSSVTSIGVLAFEDCSSLTIYAQTASKQAGWSSFWNFSNCPVVWDSVNNNIASDGNIYAVLEGIRYALKDGNATVVGQPSAITTANIPASVTFNNSTYNVTSIGDGAFLNCSSLTSVTIPTGVTSIGVQAFDGCSSLISVTIPASVTSIGGYTFRGCSSLASITVESGNTKYKSIDGNLYSKDGSTLFQYAIGKTATSFTIPSSVTRIDYEAFRNCGNLTSVTIPASVTSIGDEAFKGCSFTINCEATSQPSGWSDKWKDGCYANVVWGYTGA